MKQVSTQDRERASERLEREKRQPGHRPAPLQVWIFALLFSLVFVDGFKLAANQVPLPTLQAFWNHNRDRLKRFAAMIEKEPDKLKIVILGNSTIRHATDLDDESMTFRGVEDVRVLRIVNTWANFTDFAPLSDAILDLHPDVIFMQADLLGRKRLLAYSSEPAELQNYLQWCLLGQGDWNPYQIDQFELQTDQVDYIDQSEERFKRRILAVTEWQEIDLSSPDAQQAEQFIETALGRGIAIVLHFTPVTERAAPLQAQLESQLSAAVTRIVKQEGVTLLEYPSSMDDDQFGDFVHMNAKGRSAYMRWLVPEITEIARQNQIAD